jgi:hypothetical protein
MQTDLQKSEKKSEKKSKNSLKEIKIIGESRFAYAKLGSA